MFPASCSSGIMAHGTGEASDRGKGMDEAEFFSFMQLTLQW